MQAINWNDYQAFLAIAQAGQLARAARIAMVDATTMGRRLRRLESRLGTTLFEQTREGQILTEAGEALLATVEQMARAAADIERKDPGQGLSGHVRISVSEGFGRVGENLNFRLSCQTGDMTEDRLYLIDTFAFIFSVSAVPIREASPLGVEVAGG